MWFKEKFHGQIIDEDRSERHQRTLYAGQKGSGIAEGGR